jgi:DsbC/DsbD-like thiol-disulfide interchange protein/cytochrome c biogenesis protein CcdA
MKSIFAILFLILVWDTPVYALKEAHTEVELLSEVQSAKAGQPFLLGLRMRMDPGWHVYWENPGDSGLPPSIKWTLPNGWKSGIIEWPVPERIDLPPLRSYGYQTEVIFPVEITPAAASNNQPVKIKADVSWLTCQVDCIPGKGQLTLEINVGDRMTIDSVNAPVFKQAQSRLPYAKNPWVGTVGQTDHSWILHFTGAPPPASAYFFPRREDVILHAAEQKLTKTSDGFTLEIPKSNLLTHPPNELEGILEADNQGFQSVNPVSIKPSLSLIAACAFAFVGGLILNLMPCVLPVLSLKVIGLTAHRYTRRQSIQSGSFFAAGVLVSFWILAGLLLLIKGAGHQIGWGFQFQSPWFVGVMAILFLIFAFNLFGFFEIGLGLTGVGALAQSAQGRQRDFLSGFLATVVATPCTAPLMGTAISYALTQPAIVSLLIFSCLGLGMAFPMVLVCSFPAFLKFLPKPGPWMSTLKRVMGIFMLLSALWLVWVLALQLNVLSGKTKWETYSPSLIQQLQDQKKDYFLDFTAAWCLTCQVNDRLVLQNPKVVEKFKDHSIILVKADWTKYDPVITSALSHYGRNSIPLYVYYSSRQGEEKNLGETITVQGLINTLDQN